MGFRWHEILVLEGLFDGSLGTLYSFIRTQQSHYQITSFCARLMAEHCPIEINEESFFTAAGMVWFVSTRRQLTYLQLEDWLDHPLTGCNPLAQKYFPF